MKCIIRRFRGAIFLNYYLSRDFFGETRDKKNRKSCSKDNGWMCGVCYNQPDGESGSDIGWVGLDHGGVLITECLWLA